jgi:hypothetical protein
MIYQRLAKVFLIRSSRHGCDPDDFAQGVRHLPQLGDSSSSPQVLAQNFPPHCRLIAAQRIAGDASCETLNAQLTPSALRPVLPAAKAALDTVTQITRSTAAMISIISLMARASRILLADFRRGDLTFAAFPGAIS